jgi:hypothetical protein
MKTSLNPSDPARAAFLRLSAAALGLGLAACAQAPYRGEHHRELAAAMPAGRLEESLAEFRDDLNLSASQRPTWERYARALHALAHDAERERARARTLADMTVQRRIEHQVEVARDRYAAMEDIADAARALYATLSPAQQAVANPRLAGIVEMIAGAPTQMIAGAGPHDASPRIRRGRRRRNEGNEEP